MSKTSERLPEGVMAAMQLANSLNRTSDVGTPEAAPNLPEEEPAVEEEHKAEVDVPPEPEIPTLPTAEEMAARIRSDLANRGKEFRRTHPDLVKRLAEFLGGIHAGSEVFVNNAKKQFNVDEVTECLYGLGYEVRRANAMINSAYGGFWIRWCPADKNDPTLG